MDIKLIKAEGKDIPILLDIERTVSGEKTYSALLTEGEWIEELEKSTIYIIEKDNKNVGSVSYEVRSDGHAYISGLAIAKEFQGQGIGREVMKILLEKLKDFKKVSLVTHPENSVALELYKSFGFVVGERMENYFGDGEPRVELILEN